MNALFQRFPSLPIAGEDAPLPADRPRTALRRVLLAAACAAFPAAYAQPSDRPDPPDRQHGSAMLLQAPLVSTTATSSPRNSGGPLDAAFRRADTDGDGRLSRRETDHFPVLAERFEQIDRDADQYLSREEFGRAAQD